jgi:cytochrome c
MKTVLVTLALLAAACGPAHAVSSAKLAQDKQCTQCHALDKDTIGPSFRKMGVIYRRMNKPETRLIEVMRLGSAAHLGPMAGRARMPDDSERPRLSQREAKQLARWILSLRAD